MSGEEIFEETKIRLDKFAALAAKIDQNEAFLKRMRQVHKDDPEVMEMIEEAERELAESRKHMEIGRNHLKPLRKLFYR